MQPATFKINTMVVAPLRRVTHLWCIITLIMILIIIFITPTDPYYWSKLVEFIKLPEQFKMVKREKQNKLPC